MLRTKGTENGREFIESSETLTKARSNNAIVTKITNCKKIMLVIKINNSYIQI